MAEQKKSERRKALEEAAEVARFAPGQDWADNTTPAQMAHFIAEIIMGMADACAD
jgi:hypothetical protein